MVYQVLFWHTSGSIPKAFMDMLYRDIVEVDNDLKEHIFIDFNKHPFPNVIAALGGLNMMILNDVKAIFIDSRRFRQS